MWFGGNARPPGPSEVTQTSRAYNADRPPPVPRRAAPCVVLSRARLPDEARHDTRTRESGGRSTAPRRERNAAGGAHTLRIAALENLAEIDPSNQSAIMAAQADIRAIANQRQAITGMITAGSAQKHRPVAGPPAAPARPRLTIPRALRPRMQCLVRALKYLSIRRQID